MLEKPICLKWWLLWFPEQKKNLPRLVNDWQPNKIFSVSLKCHDPASKMQRERQYVIYNMEGQETNVKSKIAFSSVTAIARISGFQEIVVLNMLHFNDYSFVTEDDSSGTLHNRSTERKHSNLVIPIVSLIVTKGNLFLNIINDKLLYEIRVILSGSFSQKLRENIVFSYPVLYCLCYGDCCYQENELRLHASWLYPCSSLGGTYLHNLHPWAFMDRNVQENTYFTFEHELTRCLHISILTCTAPSSLKEQGKVIYPTFTPW